MSFCLSKLLPLVWQNHLISLCCPHPPKRPPAWWHFWQTEGYGCVTLYGNFPSWLQNQYWIKCICITIITNPSRISKNCHLITNGHPNFLKVVSSYPPLSPTEHYRYKENDQLCLWCPAASPWQHIWQAKPHFFNFISNFPPAGIEWQLPKTALRKGHPAYTQDSMLVSHCLPWTIEGFWFMTP